MTDADAPMPPHADETPLVESQDAIDDAKRFAAEHLDVATDEPSDQPESESDAELDDLPGGGDAAPANGPAPAP